MAQNTVLAAGNTAATSSDIVVTAGAVVTVGVFAASGVSINIPHAARFNLLIETPGADQFVASFDNQTRQHVLAAPGTYKVSRNAYTGTAFGVFTET